LVCPSLYEGFGLVPLEAMARGCPVVTTRLGSLPEVCADAAIYVDPNQPRQIAEALSRVLVRPESTRELVERGRARARAMTWEAAGRAHLALIDRVTRVDVDARSLSAGGHDEPIGVDALP
jgi:glycosyltransferase involved in cell wall biosynthesis